MPSKCVSYAWVARGSRGSRAGRARVANFNSRSGNTRVARGPSAEYILLLLSRGSVSDPRPIQKKHRVRSLSGERGFHQGGSDGKTLGPREWNFRAVPSYKIGVRKNSGGDERRQTLQDDNNRRRRTTTTSDERATALCLSERRRGALILSINRRGKQINCKIMHT